MGNKNISIQNIIFVNNSFLCNFFLFVAIYYAEASKISDHTYKNSKFSYLKEISH